LEGESWVDLERMMLHGTKVAAQAGRDTFRREKTLQKRLEAAREVVRQLAGVYEISASFEASRCCGKLCR
jgi:hypothetical protein